MRITSAPDGIVVSAKTCGKGAPSVQSALTYEMEEPKVLEMGLDMRFKRRRMREGKDKKEETKFKASWKINAYIKVELTSRSLRIPRARHGYPGRRGSLWSATQRRRG
jgi:hypothetical protein